MKKPPAKQVKPVKAWALVTPEHKLMMIAGSRMPRLLELKSDALPYVKYRGRHNEIVRVLITVLKS